MGSKEEYEAERKLHRQNADFRIREAELHAQIENDGARILAALADLLEGKTTLRMETGNANAWPHTFRIVKSPS